jgi:hypothetical protein
VLRLDTPFREQLVQVCPANPHSPADAEGRQVSLVDPLSGLPGYAEGLLVELEHLRHLRHGEELFVEQPHGLTLSPALRRTWLIWLHVVKSIQWQVSTPLARTLGAVDDLE